MDRPASLVAASGVLLLSLMAEADSEALRQVVILHYTGGLTLRETAEALACSEGTVKSRLNAAITKLRSMLE